MNVITIAGTLGKDAEIRHLNNGDAVCSFSVADSAGRDKPTIWWNCSLFGKRGEALSEYLVKGQQVTVSGSITEREWTDRDGQKRKSMDVRVNEIKLQGSGRDNGAQEQRQAPRREQRNTQAPQRSQGGGGFEDMGDDIPFMDPLKSRAFCWAT